VLEARCGIPRRTKHSEITFSYDTPDVFPANTAETRPRPENPIHSDRTGISSGARIYRAEDCTEMDPFQDTTFSGQLNAECRRILPILSHFYAIFCRVQHFAGVLGLQPRQFAYFISVGRRGSHERFQVGVHTWPIQYRFYLHGHSGILGALMTYPPKSLYAVERHYFLHSGCESDRKGFSARADTCALACRQNGLL
jgi:hypothetical protein